MNQKPLVVCFTAGTSGHFLAYIIANMLHGIAITINEDGSAHDNQIPLYLPHVVIDDNPASLSEEEAQLAEIPFHEIAMAHTRNLAALVERGKRVVYITFDSHDIAQIKSNLYHKVDSLNEQAYSIMAGTSWPPYSGPENVPAWIKQEMHKLNCDVLDRWRWIIPKDKNSCFAVEFADITRGNFVKPLAEFLGVSVYDVDYINAMIEHYKSKQLSNLHVL